MQTSTINKREALMPFRPSARAGGRPPDLVSGDQEILHAALYRFLHSPFTKHSSSALITVFNQLPQVVSEFSLLETLLLKHFHKDSRAVT